MQPSSALDYIRHGQTPFFRLPLASPGLVGESHRFTTDGREPKAILLGVPYDSGTTYLPGARVAPYHVRRVSALVSGYHPRHRLDVFAEVPALDGGNVPTSPFNAALMHELVEVEIGAVQRAGAVPFVVGGDHSITAPILQSIHAHHGPVCLIHVDAHFDTSDASDWGEASHHGTPIRHAIEQGWVARDGLIQVGLRGGWKHSGEDELVLGHGAHLFPAAVFEERRVPAIAQEIRALVGDRPVYISVDVDGVDPAYAPGTGTPVPGGLSSRELLSLLAKLAGIQLVGMDVVEVSPPQDHADMTSLLAAHLLFEGLGLLAVERSQAAKRA